MSSLRLSFSNRINNLKSRISSSFKSKKQKANAFYDKTKKKAVAYKDTMSTCYNIGYSSGKQDYNKLPKVAGAYKSATLGYGKSLKDCKKYEKLKKKM